MSDYDRGLSRPVPASADMAVDAGLRSFMLGVYNKMALGLIVTAVLAYATASVPQLRDIFFIVRDGRLAGLTTMGVVLQWTPLALLLGSMFLAKNATPRSAGLIYWAIVSVIGVWMAYILLRYTGPSIASTFLITASSFGALSLYGYVTKRDLTALGSFLIMGVWGLLAASVVNYFFFKSSLMVMIISVVGVAIFAGLTAYDTQRLKLMHYELGGDAARRNVATSFGALNLYLDFINIFVFLMNILGVRR